MNTIKEMNVDPKSATDFAYYYKQTLSAPGYGDVIRIPGGRLNCIAHTLDGTGSVEVTAYPLEDVIADTALWETLPSDVEVLSSVTAIRQLNVSGTTVLNVRCQ